MAEVGFAFTNTKTIFSDLVLSSKGKGNNGK